MNMPIKVERQIKLNKYGVDHHKAADGERAGGNVSRREQHAEDGADGEAHRLAGVQYAERGVGADRGLLVARHGGIEAARLVILIAEIFYRLVIEQAVDGLRVRLGI